MARSFSPLPPSIMAIIILATLHFTPANAQQKPSFVWGFTGEESTTTRLTECKPTTVFVNGSFYTDVAGEPPYYLVAFPPYGIPTKTNLGSDLKNLVWTVPYSPGTRLIIGMVDGNDNAGGIATQIFPVGASQGTKCHDANPTTPVKLEVVSKGALNTCGILSVHITGGQKPYTFVLAETDTIRATANVTMGPNDDQFDFVNILKPGSQFVAAAIDANGVFSSATDLITTQGGGDTSCPGQINQSKIYSPPSGFPLPAIAGIVAGVLIISAFIFWFIRRRQQQKGNMGSTDLLQGAPLSPRHQDGYTDSHPNHGITPYVIHDPEAQFDPYSDHNHQRPPPQNHLSPNNGQIQLPGSHSGASSGAGSTSAPWSPTMTHGGREGSVIFSDTVGGSSSSGVVAPYGTGTSSQQLVVQHQDASDVVELPPAYVDRPPQAILGAPTRTEQRRRKN